MINLYTEEKAINFFKLKEESQKELNLLNEAKLILQTKDNNYFGYIINGSVVLFQEHTNNYMKLVNSLHSKIVSFKLLPKSTPRNSIIIESTISELNEKNDFNSDLFNLPTVITSEKLNEEDVNKLCIQDDLVKIENKNNVMTITSKGKLQISRIYNRSDIINLLIIYIVKLVEEKKKLNKTIHNTIGIYFSTQSQNLLISESSGVEESTTKGYIDKNLSNTFILCSLEDLAIDRTKLKIWLNKIIYSRDQIEKIYFN